jgi:hypothetical protein
MTIRPRPAPRRTAIRAGRTHLGGQISMRIPNRLAHDGGAIPARLRAHRVDDLDISVGESEC